MPHELPKSYEPGAIETRWADYWIKEKLFSVKTPPPGETRPVFTLLLPPPNVTGRLHMGHMLNQTQMDIIVRWHRMRGFITLWLPGTDHAGIATQMMVETRARQRRQEAPRAGPREIHRARLGMEEALWRRDSRPDEAPRRLRRLGPRILHHGRESFARGARGVRPPL